MSSPRKTFMDRCISGEARLEDLEDYEERWHRSRTKMSLAEYLGMSAEEYAQFVEQPSLLSTIVEAKRDGVPPARVLSNQRGKRVALR